jgi:lactoylglutathione lyase
MQLGAFSVSLAVKDLAASKAFYEKLGFKSLMDPHPDDWVILKNGDHIIGLFQGMFEKNMLTFNPGWDQDAAEVNPFTDVRELQKALKAQGAAFVQEADETGEGPTSFVIEDPDGNPILVDQHR